MIILITASLLSYLTYITLPKLPKKVKLSVLGLSFFWCIFCFFWQLDTILLLYLDTNLSIVFQLALGVNLYSLVIWVLLIRK